MIYFPSSVVIQLDAVDYSCVQFCAYHNTAKVGSTEFYYGVMPDLSVGGCSVGCGGSAQVTATRYRCPCCVKPVKSTLGSEAEQRWSRVWDLKASRVRSGYEASGS